ncbi:MAG: hypothetical protein D6800_04015, partial [Candidatus Zixiibacteriota bacterium]
MRGTVDTATVARPRSVGLTTLCCIGALLVLLLTEKTNGQLSPGELHRSHAFLEGIDNCEKCHARDHRDLSVRCLKCHTAIRDRRAAGQGLHAGPDYADCALCHVEHQGRDYALIYFKGGKKAFQHDLTGYKLEGRHAQLDCRKCHNPDHIRDRDTLAEQAVNVDSTYLGLSTDCLSCHVEQHRGQLSKDCRRCHDFNGWKPAATFSHDSARFVLTGKHKQVDCVKCHPRRADTTAQGIA